MLDVIQLFIIPCSFLLILGLALLYPRYLWYLLVFTIPFSIDIGTSITLSFPCEVLGILLAISLIIRLIFSFFRPNNKELVSFSLFRSPIFLCILLYLLTLFFSVFYSEMPIVSLKKTLIHGLFIFLFFVYPTRLFQERREIYRFFICYLAGLMVAIAYALGRHATYSFTTYAAADMPKPLFADHTLYGAVLVFVFPYIIYLFINKIGRKKALAENISINRFSIFKPQKIYSFSLYRGLLLLIVGFAIITAASRAAWIGLIAAAFIAGLMHYKVKLRWLLTSILIAAFSLYSYHNSIVDLLRHNKAQSSNPSGNFSEHFLSVTNIESDVSNQERINRWLAAYDMFKERPFSGFGIGTYQFSYAPYQRFYLLTQISTRNADRGGAHSEYLTILSEQGIFSLLAFLLLALIVVRESFHLIYQIEDKNAKLLYISLILGLFTYWVHCFFNAFLDQIELVSLVWAAIAAIAVGRQKV